MCSCNGFASLYGAYARLRGAVSNSYAVIRIFPTIRRAFAPLTGRVHMTMSHTHRGEMFDPRGQRRGSRFLAARAVRKVTAAFKALHCAIVAAKLHRLRNELVLHRRTRARVEFDAARFPQQPMIRGDIWDF